MKFISYRKGNESSFLKTYHEWESRWIVTTAVLLGIGIMVMPILKLLSLHTSFYDLGHYSSLVYTAVKGQSWERLFWGHAHPLLLPYAALYYLIPSPILLLSLQSVALLTSGWVLLVLWRRLVLSGSIYFILIYLLSISVWYSALQDFHLDHLLFLFFALLFWNLESRDTANVKLRVVIIALLICMIKEVYALTACMVGCYVIIRKRWYLTGLIIVILAILYFYVVVSYVIPFFTVGASVLSIWSKAFSYLGKDFSGIISNLVKHPYLLVTECFDDWWKVIYIGILFGTFLFIPLLSLSAILPALPSLAISILSRNPNHYGITHQYTAGVVAPLLVAFVLSMHKLQRIDFWDSSVLVKYLKTSVPRLFRQPSHNFYWVLIGSTALVHVMISPSPFSRYFISNKVWSYGYEAYIPTLRDQKIKRKLEEVIPSDPRVSVSTQNTLNNAWLSNRYYYMAFPMGVIRFGHFPDAKHSVEGLMILADYVVLDVKRPWYLEDQGCQWQLSAPIHLTPKEVALIGLAEDPGPLPWASCVTDSFRGEFVEAIRRTMELYDKVYEWDGFLILKRR